MLLTFFDMSARTHYLNARQTLRKLLDWRVVPVINENDTTTTDEISFGDNDFLAAQVAILVGADLLVLLTDTEGVFTADPRDRPGGARWSARSRLRRAGRARHRPRHLAAGLGRDALEGRRGRDGDRRRHPDGDQQRPRRRRARGSVLAGEAVGTRFPRPQARYSSLQAVAAVRQARRAGTVRVDAGAARALREGGTSLLPVGIVDVSGAFDAGDAVDVRRRRQPVIGKGIFNYWAAELRQVAGLKSAAVRELLPRATEEAVHRDYFVLA